MAGNYFNSYQDFDVHRLMLDDKPRVEAYREAITKNKHLFTDKVVMDVGSGCGILSVFCAQAGARKVLAVEASEMAKVTDAVVEENDFCGIITVFQTRVEDLVLEEKVDVIISEWMGFYLLHEGMLDSVLVARDKFLKDDGLMFPEHASLWVSPCKLPQYYSYWDEKYGVKMECIGEFERESKTKPVILEVPPENLLGNETEVFSISLKTLQVDELEHFSKKINTPCDETCHGFCIWFNCEFPGGVRLDTHPNQPPTHWKQTVVVLPDEIYLEPNGVINFEIDLRRNADNNRLYNITFSLLEHTVPCLCSATRCAVIRAFVQQTDQNDENVLEDVIVNGDEEDIDN